MRRIFISMLAFSVICNLTGCGFGGTNNQITVIANEDKNESSTVGNLPSESVELAEKEASGPDSMQMENIIYAGVQLYSKPMENMVSIEVQPSIIREKSSYYYIPGEEEQSKLLLLLNETEEQWEMSAASLEGRKEVGYAIWHNGTRYTVFDDGYFYASKYDEEYGMLEFMEQKEELYVLIQSMMKEIGYEMIEPTVIKDIASAKLELTGFRTNGELLTQTISDRETLALFEEWFSESTYILFGAECGNQAACLELTLTGGETVNLSLATDSCPNFGVNGVYYNYTPEEYRKSGGWHSDDLLKYFDEIYYEININN